MSEESIRLSILRPTRHTTELYAQTVKLPTNEEAKVISQRFADHVEAYPQECVRPFDDFWNLSNQNSAECNKNPVITGVQQPIGSNGRCRVSLTVGNALSILLKPTIYKYYTLAVRRSCCELIALRIQVHVLILSVGYDTILSYWTV
jgi:hypothetical protein